ncbi:uncharacterized protein LOC129946294 [Eupeodes corollae]|uniref:uncharacterized protein LOC129946294 n=1 Tax=Eupeodes corollae TaxID=290404 RepID=UPI00249116D3|nr:uncharacterized protein LOC129946294 [Eupeodes corollae]
MAMSSKASTLLAAIQRSDFLVSLMVCEKLFSLTLPLSIFLQNESLNFVSAINHTKQVLSSLKNIRETARDAFQSASQLARDLFEVSITIPRLSLKQTTSSNPETSCSEDYFRVSVFIRCLDSLIQNLTDKFMVNEDVLLPFQTLLPDFAAANRVNEMENLTLYFDIAISLSAVKAEYIFWCEKISSMDPSSDVLKLLDICDKTYFRSISYLLTILATLPVTTASVERTFSTIKRIKTVSRSVMGHQRLSALAMMSVHSGIDVDPDEGIDIMSKKKTRRLLL